MPLSLVAKPPVSKHDDQRDRALLLAVASRDQGALEQLYQQYRRPLLQFLSRLQPARDSVDEAINETFWVVWCRAHQFRGDSLVSTWITGIAWRCTLSALRRNNGRPRSSEQLPVSTEAPAFDVREHDERAEWLARGLASLPVEQRATLELAYYQGHSCLEIAQIMDCPVNTVKARMFQARIKLRNLLPQLGGSDAPSHGGY
jgi:RNA polymerase sigma-70 factor (ECF subfamily)